MDLQQLLDNARRNEALLRRLQAFELQLLSCQSWSDLLRLLLQGLPEQFGLDDIRLCLVDADGQLYQSMGQSLTPEQAPWLEALEFVTHLPQCRPGPVAVNPPWHSGLVLPLLRHERCLGKLTLFSTRRDRFGDDMATDFLQHLAAVIAACLVMVEQSEQQARLALTDPLTEVENRRGFERLYTREWARGLRQFHEFAVILLDLDFFKQVNDQHGHATGDRALQALCNTLRQVVRPSDPIGRLGGEEFALLVPGCSWAQLEGLVPRIQQAIRQMDVRNDRGQPVTMAASGSYLVLTPKAHSSVELDQVIRLLDKYLYKAKAQGRDCFLAARPPN